MSTMNTFPRTHNYFRFVLFLFITYLPCLSYADTFIAKVVGVSDGDTVTVVLDKPCNSQKNCKGGKVQYRIRLAEIDAPEKNQPWGNKAKQALTMLVATKNVTVLSSGRDRYGRTLGTLFLNEKNINKLMVQNGDAWVYTKYVTDYEYFRLQDQAKNNKIGLWSMDESQIISPWKWRHNAKSKKTK